MTTAIPFNVPLILEKESDRAILINRDGPLNDYMASYPTNLSTDEELQLFVAWYVNRNVEKAIQKTLSDSTKEQHTVPRLTNKCLGKHFNSVTYEVICGTSIKFPQGPYNIKATYDLTNKIWNLQPFPNKKLSVFRNIYDFQHPDLPSKFIECFLWTFETDVAKIIQRISKDINAQEISWAERVILSCYGVLQNARTNEMKTLNNLLFSKMVELEQHITPVMKKEDAVKSILKRLDISSEGLTFGSSVLKSLTLENINNFFKRKWTFLKAPDGLLTSLHPLGAFDLDHVLMFGSGFHYPTHLMLPLGRNLLWVASNIYDEHSALSEEEKLVLSTEDNQFVNRILSLRINEIHCHPEDADKIIPYLSRTEAIEFYLKGSSLLDEVNNQVNHQIVFDLFGSIPRRWFK